MKPTQKQSTNFSRMQLEDLMNAPIDVKAELLQHHLSLAQILANELLEQEVIDKAGERYSHDKPHDGRYSRWGYNPGSIQIGDQRLKVAVPRIRDNEHQCCVQHERYQSLRYNELPSDQLIKGVLLGLSMRDYEGVIDHLGEGFGIKKSSVSRAFVERSEERLEEFEQRDLSKHEIIGVFIDGKYLAKEQIMIVLGVDMSGRKIPLGFLQTHSENSEPIKDLFEDLIARGLRWEEGLLFVIDGSKGIKKAVKETFGKKAVIQRCTWHKRENVKKYLKNEDQKWFESEYHSALDRAKYKDAKTDIDRLIMELKEINVSAGRSLEEGKEELLTLHKLKIRSDFGRTFATTNPIENLNSQLGKYIRKVKNWKNSKMRYRWIASGLMEIEEKMRRVSNYKKLPKLKKAIKKYIRESSQDET